MSDMHSALPVWVSCILWLGCLGIAGARMSGMTGRLKWRNENGIQGVLCLAVAACLALYPHWLASFLAVMNAAIGAVGVHYYVTHPNDTKDEPQ